MLEDDNDARGQEQIRTELTLKRGEGNGPVSGSLVLMNEGRGGSGVGDQPRFQEDTLLPLKQLTNGLSNKKLDAVHASSCKPSKAIVLQYVCPRVHR